jgi:undecaprenyl-diphosphatase
MERLGAYDLGMLYWFMRWRSPWLNETVLTLTHLGDRVVLLAVAASGAILLTGLRRPRLALVLLAATLLGWGLEWGVKKAVGRPRPQVAEALAQPPDQPSFPSGHALGTMAVYGSLGLLLARALSKHPAPFVACGAALSLVVGLTRLVIGVHYPFDVAAGWVAGALCVGVAAALAGPPEPPSGEAGVAPDSGG